MIKKHLFIYLLIFFSTFLCAQNGISLPQSFRASFNQSVTSDQKKQIVYKGTIEYSAPNKFKWKYISPTKKEVCSDGKELVVVDHDLEQVSFYMMEKGLDMVSILKNAKPHRKSVYIAKYNDKYYTIQVNKKGELSRIAYRDDLDNNVLIIFSKMRYSNRKISDKKMECSYPKNYDLIGG